MLLLAAVATPVSPTPIPWGNLIVVLVGAFTPSLLLLAGGAFAWFKSKLPAAVVTMLNAEHADTLVNRAVNQAIAMVDGAVKGKTVNVTIANSLIQQAAELLLQNAPGLIAALGSRVGPVIAGKLVDMNMLGADASATTLKDPILPIVVGTPPAKAEFQTPKEK